MQHGRHQLRCVADAGDAAGIEACRHRLIDEERAAHQQRGREHGAVLLAERHQPRVDPAPARQQPDPEPAQSQRQERSLDRHAGQRPHHQDDDTLLARSERQNDDGYGRGDRRDQRRQREGAPRNQHAGPDVADAVDEHIGRQHHEQAFGQRALALIESGSEQRQISRHRPDHQRHGEREDDDGDQAGAGQQVCGLILARLVEGLAIGGNEGELKGAAEDAGERHRHQGGDDIGIDRIAGAEPGRRHRLADQPDGLGEERQHGQGQPGADDALVDGARAVLPPVVAKPGGGRWEGHPAQAAHG